MERSCLQLIDLPNEILLLILNKLTRIEVLYSLLGVNLQLDQFLNDPVFTEHLILMEHSSDGANVSLDDTILDRFCSEILPKIHHQIKWLNLEALSMENLLLAADYPNLHSLSLFNIDFEIAVRLFAEKTHMDRIFKNQITTLIITFADHFKKEFPPKTLNVVCTHVLNKFKSLRCLEYYPYCDLYLDHIERLSCKSIEPSALFSSSLTTLHINVEDFTDCLYLLDGRLKQLHTFYVNVHFFWPPSSSPIINQKELIEMKCFSLTSNITTMFFDESIVPLLNRMLNLEELFLNISVERHFPSPSFVDGNTLKKDILNSMPDLKKFVFSIHSAINDIDSNSLPSNDDIQRSLKSLGDCQIVSFTDYFPNDRIGQCHIFTYQYELDSLYRLTNNFPGGYFPFVQEVSLIDHLPFEHEFFMRIARAFPSLRSLVIDNQTPQNRQQSNEDHSNLPIIEYPHLSQLIIFTSHSDYLEQFLNANKTCLRNCLKLIPRCSDLQLITNNFTRDETRINCAKVKYLDRHEQWNVPSHFYDYFSRLEKL